MGVRAPSPYVLRLINGLMRKVFDRGSGPSNVLPDDKIVSCSVCSKRKKVILNSEGESSCIWVFSV